MPDKHAKEGPEPVAVSADAEAGEASDAAKLNKAWDIGARYAGYFDDHEIYTSKEEKKLRWRFDLRILPFLW